MKSQFRKSLIGLRTLVSKLLPLFWIKLLLLRKQIGKEPIKPHLTWKRQRIYWNILNPENWNFDERGTMDSSRSKEHTSGTLNATCPSLKVKRRIYSSPGNDRSLSNFKQFDCSSWLLCKGSLQKGEFRTFRFWKITPSHKTFLSPSRTQRKRITFLQ